MYLLNWSVLSSIWFSPLIFLIMLLTGCWWFAVAYGWHPKAAGRVQTTTIKLMECHPLQLQLKRCKKQSKQSFSSTTILTHFVLSCLLAQTSRREIWTHNYSAKIYHRIAVMLTISVPCITSEIHCSFRWLYLSCCSMASACYGYRCLYRLISIYM